MTANRSGTNPPFKGRILVIGGGSIGKRHAKNCAVLGADVGIYDAVPETIHTFCNENGFSQEFDLAEALLKNNYKAALVCTPNHIHVPVARQVIEAGLDVFIEKPLSHNYEGVESLIGEILRKRIIAMGGFNLRFEPGLQYIRRNLDLRKVAFAEIESGSYMPAWRSGVDYRKTYSANKSMGGGIILDDVHELDYACWLFGYPDAVRCSFGKFSDFDIDVEDTAVFHFRYPDKLVTIHSDYLQKRYSRWCKICLRDGSTIEWVFGSHVTEYYHDEEKTFSYKSTFDINTLYLLEMETFLHHITTRSNPESDILNAAKILRIALNVKQND